MAKRPINPVLLTLAGMLALAAAMGIGRFVYTPILPFMAASVPLSPSQAGLIASANFLGYLAGALLVSATFLPGSRKAWLIGGLAASALTTLAVGLTASLAMFLMLRFAGGVASAFVLVFSSALLLDRLALAGRPGLVGVHFAGVGIGIALSAVLVSTVAALGQDWSMLWVASGLVSLLALLAVAIMVPDADEARTPSPRPVGGALDMRLVALIAAYGLFGFGYVISATFISAIVRHAPEIRHLEAVIWLIVGLAGVPSVAFWTWIGRWTGNTRAFALSCAVEAIGVALIVVWPSAIGIILAAIFLGGTIMGITAVGIIHARALSAGDPRRIVGLMTAAFGLGQIIGPAFAGVVVDATGSFDGPNLAAVAALLSAAALSLKAETIG